MQKAVWIRSILEDFDCAPGSIQPVVWMNKEGERALGLMRWGSSCQRSFFSM
jgi:hypothetical protein